MTRQLPSSERPHDDSIRDFFDEHLAIKQSGMVQVN